MRTLHLTREELTERRQQRAARAIATGKDTYAYTTTAESCSCPDWVNRCQYLGVKCYHQETLALESDLQARTLQQQTAPAKYEPRPTAAERTPEQLAELRRRGAEAVRVLRGDGDDSLV